MNRLMINQICNENWVLIPRIYNFFLLISFQRWFSYFLSKMDMNRPKINQISYEK